MNHPTTPATAADVKAMIRSQNIRVGLLGVAFIMALVAVVWLEAGGRAASVNAADASENSAESIRATLADNARRDCISERRSAQAAADGELASAAFRALQAGLIFKDSAEVQVQIERYEKAEAERVKASAALSPEVVNQPPPKGCGPPITEPGDIPKEPGD